jgi:iron(III) transport system ATP-binding protein
MQLRTQLSSVFKHFGNKKVVDDVSFHVEEGEFLVLLGPSGCGKTTTLRLIAGLEQPDAGTIAIDGKYVSSPAEGLFIAADQRGIGMVFQSYAIWPHMSVFENVAFPLHVRGMPSKQIKLKVAEVLELVGLEGAEQRSATMLSGGQMQRVALARALVYSPTLLLFDEPLSNLDLKLRERLRVELKELQRRTGITSIYVTHDQVEAVELADRIVVMQGGKVLQVGAPAELYRRPQSRFVAEFIATANIFPGVVNEVTGVGTLRIEIANKHSIEAICDCPVSVGQRVDVIVHPEDCVLSGSAPGGNNSHLVRISKSRFQGTSTRYTVDWSGRPFDVVILGTCTLLPEGSDASLTISPQRAVALPL